MHRVGMQWGRQAAPYCSDACWHAHAKDGRAHESADTKAWADDTTNAIWE
jgi:hypothetical protein